MTRKSTPTAMNKDIIAGMTKTIFEMIFSIPTEEIKAFAASDNITSKTVLEVVDDVEIIEAALFISKSNYMRQASEKMMSLSTVTDTGERDKINDVIYQLERNADWCHEIAWGHIYDRLGGCAVNQELYLSGGMIVAVFKEPQIKGTHEKCSEPLSVYYTLRGQQRNTHRGSSI